MDDITAAKSAIEIRISQIFNYKQKTSAAVQKRVCNAAAIAAGRDCDNDD